jgi:ABC-type antimicrobial peptide transport system permease subunit
VRLRYKLWGLLGTVGLLGLSLLPLSSLLLAFPALVPQESVLNEAVSRKRSWFFGILGRLSSLVLGLTLLLTILAISVEIVSRLPLPAQGSFNVVPKSLLFAPEAFLGRTEADKKQALSAMTPELREFCKTPLYEKLPTALVEHWPFVFLTMYLLDLVVLLFIGSVPLNYNLRNVRVRWKTNAMTALAFMAVVGLLSFLLAFVNGMNNLTQNTGVPGNVFVLSDGATDEVFSNLAYGDLNNVERIQADELQVMDSAGKPVLDDSEKELWKPITALGIRTTTKNGRPAYLASKETYYSINMVVQNVVPEKRRFVQLRTLDDGPISGMVHNVEFLPGGKWFSEVGVDNESRIECVLGEGVARTIGEDYGKKTLVVGDVFRLGDSDWVVAGIMKSEGTTFGSEIWAKRIDRIFKPFGKDSFTTLVLRSEKESLEASRAIANYLSKRYTQQKLKAFAEPDYYAELTKTNNTFLVAIIIVCIVMAIGGVFGMMTTMFASIAQRIRDIGVLRLLGFKRWQVMVSFMLESLTIALIGGIAGVLLAWVFADGRSTVSTLSGGGGGPGGKSVALKIVVSSEVMAMGLLFALAMGRLGGLVPALSAMQKKILDSLR